MRKYSFILILFLLAKSYSSCAQLKLKHPAIKAYYPGKTLRFEKLPTGTKIELLDSLYGEIMDSFNSPKIYIIKTKNNDVLNAFNYLFAAKKDNYYSVYPILISSYKIDSTRTYKIKSDNSPFSAGYSKSGSITNIEKYKLKKSKNELIIIQFGESERESYGYGWRRFQSGYKILYPDKLKMLTLINYERFEHWPYGDGGVITNSGDTYYFQYQITFKNEVLEIEVDGRKKEYGFRKGKFTMIE